MARSVSLTTLETRVRQRANLEVASNSALYPQSELDDDINEGIAELYDLLRQGYGQDYYLSSSNFNTVAGQDTYVFGVDIPATDFLSLRGIDVTFGQNIIITAKPFMMAERNRYKWYPGWIYTQPVFYRLEGNAIKFIPTPSGQFACTVWYTPTPPKLASGGDTFDGIAGWEEYAVLYAAIRALTKQEQFEHAQALGMLQAQMKDRILGLAANRDAESPERISDVEYTDGWIGRPSY